MKRKLFIGLIPVLMALSACNNISPKPVEERFLEDTTANENIFGSAEEIKPVRRNSVSLTAPAIGYQISYDKTKDKIAIRFVAALTEVGSTIKAEWKRGVAAADGTVPQSKDFSDAAQVANNYYLSLTSGAGTIEAGKGDYSAYAGFVVYTLHNIPYSTYSNSYVAAYLSIYDESDREGTEKQSDVLAVKVEKIDDNTSANTFSFVHGDGGGRHFLQGTIDGANQIINATENPTASSFAGYFGINLRSTDSFGSFYYDSSAFQYFGHSTYFNESSDYFTESDSQSGYNTPTAAGVYTLYLSNGSGLHNHVYTNEVTVSYLEFTNLDSIRGWNPTCSGFSIHAWTSSGDVFSMWSNMERVNGEDKYRLVYAGTFSGFLLYFWQDSQAIKSYSVTNKNFEQGKTYTISIAPGNPWGSEDGVKTFGSGITVSEKA